MKFEIEGLSLDDFWIKSLIGFGQMYLMAYF